jgi:sporulation protein YlmC with PRC-barrel domain
MDIPVNADVYCNDQRCGVSTYIIVNPTTKKITHLVVKEKGFPHTERLVSIDLVLETSPDRIQLRNTQYQLAEMEPFIETEFIPTEIPEYVGDQFMIWPYAIPETEMISVEHERIPPGELAVRRGARVEAIDGHVGRVDELLVHPADGHITHLVLREGHLWGQKDVTIPVSQIDHIEEDAVYLKLDKHSVEALPAIPIRR